MSKERLQANFATRPEDQRRMTELRKIMVTPDGKIPSESAIWREALGHLHEAVVKRAADKRSRK